MKSSTLFALRIAIGFLLVFWGIDKAIDTKHATVILERFYPDAFSSQAVLTALTTIGQIEVLLGVLVIMGAGRRAVYPILVLVLGCTLVAVFPSVVDPWGWFFKRTNVLFYPSIIIFCSALVLMAFREDDRLALDRVFA